VVSLHSCASSAVGLTLVVPLNSTSEQIFATNVRLVDELAVVIVVLAGYHLFVLSEATIVRKFELISLRRCETSLYCVVNCNRMLLGEEGSGDFSERLGHSVSVDHTTHVTSVAWDLLAADFVGGSRDPVQGILARIAIDIWIHLGPVW